MCFTRRVYFWGIIKILPLSPRPPSPMGKGETLGYFMQGASPLASPGRSRGGTGFFLPCQCFFAPIPPPPSPVGKGETLGYFMQGAKPLASPGLSRGGTGSGRGWRRPAYEPGRRWLRAGNRASGGGACLLCRLPTLPFVYLPAPIPPTPFPAGRGRLYTLFRRGLTPPAPLRNKPARRWLRAGNRASGGGLAFFSACRPCHLFTFLPLSPQPPSPVGKGETLYFISPGADAPGTPA